MNQTIQIHSRHPRNEGSYGWKKLWKTQLASLESIQVFFPRSLLPFHLSCSLLLTFLRRSFQCAASLCINLLRAPLAAQTLHSDPKNLPFSVFTLSGLPLVTTMRPLFLPSDLFYCLPDIPPEVLTLVNLSLSYLPSPSLKPSILSRLSVPLVSPLPSQCIHRTCSLI